MRYFLVLLCLIANSGCNGGGKGQGKHQAAFENGTCVQDFLWGYGEILALDSLVDEARAKDEQNNVDYYSKKLREACDTFFDSYRGKSCSNLYFDDFGNEKSETLYSSDLNSECN